MKRLLIALLIAVLGLMLLIAGYVVGRRQAPASPASTNTGKTDAGGRKVLYWYDTMVPQQHFDHPGLSPMGMQMVPKYADEAAGNPAGVVKINPATVQNLGVRTAPVERRLLRAAVQVPGTVTWNLREATTISARVDAVITKLDVRAPYTTVTAGEPLAELLAPQWNSALAEYRALQQAQSADAKALRAAARERLRVLGLTDADIRAAHPGGNTAITLHAPQAGVVTTLDVREGQRVAAGQTLMTLNSLATVWVEAALPQGTAGAVPAGTPVTVTVDAVPGRTFHGKVETLLPDIDNATRTQKARIVIDNPDGVLSPGMFASVQLAPSRDQAVPVVPDEAVIATGTHTRVILAEGEGRFRAVPVRTGRSAGGYTQVLDGLKGGEQVVTSGQFLIDSEASLSGALERLDTPAHPAPASSARSMPGMPMRPGDQP
ncbi:efflux RND transporter periplasmic adaptor subunit [Frateuria sp. GZRR35]|uniref:efflux RND transporter periplasmic adaptor subunit n=1 Tax=Frateuria TaxID=70411 RepID=UPI002260E244|nr:efflux RND transporter periplasmic adaptor subunit [Frateuria sp. STR12]MCX7514242.1 efflux RND transporter periplasmic adaptor subunit [Frateuria sp. STR12]